MWEAKMPFRCFFLFFIHFCIFFTSPGGQDTIEAVRAAQLASHPVVVISIKSHRGTWDFPLCFTCRSSTKLAVLHPFSRLPGISSIRPRKIQVKSEDLSSQHLFYRREDMELSIEAIEDCASHFFHFKANELSSICSSLMQCVESRDKVCIPCVCIFTVSSLSFFAEPRAFHHCFVELRSETFILLACRSKFLTVKIKTFHWARCLSKPQVSLRKFKEHGTKSGLPFKILASTSLAENSTMIRPPSSSRRFVEIRRIFLFKESTCFCFLNFYLGSTHELPQCISGCLMEALGQRKVDFVNLFLEYGASPALVCQRWVLSTLIGFFMMITFV